MQVKLYDNKYCVVYFDKETLIYEYHWSKETQKLNDEDFAQIVRDISALLDGKKLTKLKTLMNNRDFLFNISPELQEWHAWFVTSKMQSYGVDMTLNKTAIIISEGFISQLSIEQTIDENRAASNYGMTRYFAGITEARTWLMND